MQYSGKDVCVFIPTFNESVNVISTIQSILAGTVQPGEIIIGDGGSTDDTLQLVAELTLTLPWIRSVHNPEKFPGGGRNVAIAATQKPLIAGIDAQNHVDPLWLENLLATYNQHFSETPGVVFGRIQTEYTSHFEKLAASIFFDYSFLSESEYQKSSVVRTLISSSNILYAKSVWEQLGGYPTWIKTAEDKLFTKKLRQKGIPTAYAPLAPIYHHMRSNFKQVRRMFFQYGYGSALVDTVNPTVFYNFARFCLAFLGLAAWLLCPQSKWLLVLFVLSFLNLAKYIVRWGFINYARAFHNFPVKNIFLVPALIFVRDVFSVWGMLKGKWVYGRNARYELKLRKYLHD